MPIDNDLLKLVSEGKFDEASKIIAENSNPFCLVREEKTGETLLHKMAVMDVVEKSVKENKNLIINLFNKVDFTNPYINLSFYGIKVSSARNFLNRASAEEIIESGETAISLAIAAGNEKFAIELLSTENASWANKKSGLTYMHYAAATGRSDVIATLVELTGSKLLDCQERDTKHLPLSIALDAYRKNPTVFNMSILTQLLYIERYSRRETNYVTLNKKEMRIWEHAVEICIQRDGKGKAKSIDLSLLDFIERAAVMLNYNMAEMVAFIKKKYNKDIQKLFHDAIQAKEKDYLMRTASLRTINPHLRSINLEMHVISTNINNNSNTKPVTISGIKLPTVPTEIKDQAPASDSTKQTMSGMTFWNKYRVNTSANNSSQTLTVIGPTSQTSSSQTLPTAGAAAQSSSTMTQTPTTKKF